MGELEESMIIKGAYTALFSGGIKSAFFLQYKYRMLTATFWQKVLLLFHRSYYSIDGTTIIKLKIMKGRFYIINVMDIENNPEFHKLFKEG